MIYSVVAGLNIFILIGLVLFPAVVIFALIMVILASVKVNKGEDFKYSLSLEFIK